MGLGNKLGSSLEKYSIEAGKVMQKNFKIMEDNQILIQENQVEFQKYLEDIKLKSIELDTRIKILDEKIDDLLKWIKKQ